MTAADLARLTGISKQTISNWLDGRTRPQPAALEVLSNRTGIPLPRLYEALEPEPQSAPSSQGDWDEVKVMLRDFGVPAERVDEAVKQIREYTARYSTDDQHAQDVAQTA